MHSGYYILINQLKLQYKFLTGSDVDGTPTSVNDDDGEAPRVLRNYDVTPVRSVTTSPIQHKVWQSAN